MSSIWRDDGLRLTFCDVTISSDPRLVGITAEYLGLVCRQVTAADGDMTSRLVVATHELLDNTMRYSSGGDSRIRITVDPSRARIIIETQNHADQVRRAELAQLVAEMAASPCRHAFYQTLLRRTFKRVDGSGLGLGRVHAESEMDLTCEITGDVVCLRAEATLDDRDSVTFDSSATNSNSKQQ